MKKILLSALALFLTLAPHALAQGFVPLAEIPGLTSSDVANTPGLAAFFNNLYKYLIGLAATLAVIEIIWGGLEIAVNKENVGKITEAKGRIVQALFGLVLVLSPVLVFSIINPSILNLGISLSPLPTQSGAPGTLPDGTRPATPIVTSTIIPGCKPVTGAYYQNVQCSTREGRDQFVQSCTSGSTKVFDPPQEAPGAIYSATCDMTSGPLTGPYLFINTSSISFLYKNLQPAVSAPGNPKNGTMVSQFAQQCNVDGGVFCIQNVPLISASCNGIQTAGSSSQCYSLRVSCRDPSLAANASFPIVGGLSFNGCQTGGQASVQPVP